MKSIKVVINMECDGKASWVRSLVEVCQTQSVDQWVDWITKPPSGEEVTNIDCLITVLYSTNENYGIPDPSINSWGQPVESLKYMLRKR